MSKLASGGKAGSVLGVIFSILNSLRLIGQKSLSNIRLDLFSYLWGRFARMVTSFGLNPFFVAIFLSALFLYPFVKIPGLRAFFVGFLLKFIMITGISIFLLMALRFILGW